MGSAGLRGMTAISPKGDERSEPNLGKGLPLSHLVADVSTRKIHRLYKQKRTFPEEPLTARLLLSEPLILTRDSGLVLASRCRFIQLTIGKGIRCGR